MEVVYLHSKCAKNNGAENGVPKDPLKHVPLSMYFPSINLIKQLHHNECVEDDGVVLRWRSVERSITTTVDVKDSLTWLKYRTCDNLYLELVL